MPSRRTLMAIVAASVVVLIGLGVAGYVLSRDSATSATGDLIAYGCKERKNPWCSNPLNSSETNGPLRDLSVRVEP